MGCSSPASLPLSCLLLVLPHACPFIALISPARMFSLIPVPSQINFAACLLPYQLVLSLRIIISFQAHRI